MRISRRQLSLLIEQYLLTEAVHDKVAAQLGITDPTRIEQLRIASEKPHRLQKPELLWIGKYFTTPEGMKTEESIESIVAAIKSLDQNKAALERRGSATELFDYSTPKDIKIAVELSRGYAHESKLIDQADRIYEDDTWELWVPHTREASCTIGRGTNWCTSIPGAGNNLFYNYVIDKRVTLYYLVKKYPEAGDRPETTHMSLGAIRGKIPFPEEGKGFGGIVVDGRNNGLSRKRFESLVGKNLADHLINEIGKHQSLGGDYSPSITKAVEMLKNPALYTVEMRGKSTDARFDLTALLLNVYKKALLDNYAEDIFSDEDREAIINVFTNKSNPFHQAIVKVTEIRQKDLDDYKEALEQKNALEILKFNKIIGDADIILRCFDEVQEYAGTNIKTEFCKGVKNFKADFVTLFNKIKDFAEYISNSWSVRVDEEVLATDEDVTGVIKDVIENEFFAEIESLPEEYQVAFIDALLLYYANLLFEEDFALIIDPNSAPYSDGDLSVGTPSEFMSNTRSEMLWVSYRHLDHHSGYFSEAEIRDYLSNRYGSYFIEWCDLNDFKFASF